MHHDTTCSLKCCTPFCGPHGLKNDRQVVSNSQGIQSAPLAKSSADDRQRAGLEVRPGVYAPVAWQLRCSHLLTSSEAALVQ